MHYNIKMYDDLLNTKFEIEFIKRLNEIVTMQVTTYYIIFYKRVLGHPILK